MDAAEASVLPSGLNTTAVGTHVSFRVRKRFGSFSTFHRLTSSAPRGRKLGNALARARSLLSGLNATDTTFALDSFLAKAGPAPCSSSRRATSFRVATAHSQAAPTLPEARYLPSGLQATEKTPPA